MDWIQKNEISVAGAWKGKKEDKTLKIMSFRRPTTKKKSLKQPFVNPDNQKNPKCGRRSRGPSKSGEHSGVVETQWARWHKNLSRGASGRGSVRIPCSHHSGGGTRER